MTEDRDFDYVVGKLPRKDKEGNDATSDCIGKGGRHRDDGTYSAVAYDLKVVDEDPTKIVPTEPQVIVRREVVEVERQPQRIEELPLGQQFIYRAAEAAIPYVVDGAFRLAGKGINAVVNYGKIKYAEHKAAKPVTHEKHTLKIDDVQKCSTLASSPDTKTTALDEVDVAYENYSVNMTSEEAQKEFVDAFILRLLSEKKLWKIAHANIVDKEGNVIDGRMMIDKLSGSLMLDNINSILKNNPDLLETWQTIALEDILGRKLIVDSCYIPISGEVLKENLMQIKM